MSAPTIIARLPVRTVSTDGIRAGVAALLRSAAATSEGADVLAQQGAALTEIWQSRPSSARAEARLDALADIGRAWSARAGQVAGALTRYAATIDSYRAAALAANRLIDEHNRRVLVAPSLMPSQTASVGAAMAIACAARDDARRAEQRCAVVVRDALAGVNSGAGAGSATAISQRLAQADGLAAQNPLELAATVRVALVEQPPDWVTITAALQVLARDSTDPSTAARVIAALGPDVQRLREEAAEMAKGNPGTVGGPGGNGPGGDGPGGDGGGGEPTAAVAALNAVAALDILAAVANRARSSGGSGSGGSGSAGGGSSGGRPNAHRPASVSAEALARVSGFLRLLIADPNQVARLGPPTSGESDGGARLVVVAWAAAGVELPPMVADQYRVGESIPLAALEAGDLVFWAADPATVATPSRVGVYLGEGQVARLDPSGTRVELVDLAVGDPTLLAHGMRPATVQEAPVRRI